MDHIYENPATWGNMQFLAYAIGTCFHNLSFEAAESHLAIPSGCAQCPEFNRASLLQNSIETARSFQDNI
jgi:hypothetical protein